MDIANGEEILCIGACLKHRVAMVDAPSLCPCGVLVPSPDQGIGLASGLVTCTAHQFQCLFFDKPHFTLPR